VEAVLFSEQKKAVEHDASNSFCSKKTKNCSKVGLHNHSIGIPEHPTVENGKN
jgi:hypothetical protein